MKRLITITIIFLSLGTLGFAQSNMGMHKATQADSTMNSQQNKMMGNMNNMQQNMQNMQNMQQTPNMQRMQYMQGSYQTMLDDLQKLQAHTERMMNIDDMTKLKAELQSQDEMIKNMHANMTKNMQMYSNTSPQGTAPQVKGTSTDSPKMSQEKEK
jgi:esterase/lipase